MRKVLKYPGSKWRIANELVGLIPPHHTYLEPFFGSGAVFFQKQPSDIEMINDLDYDVTNLFFCIQENSEKLARLIMSTPYSRQVYDDTFRNDPIRNMLLEDDRYHRACRFLVQCWQGHGFRTNGYKVGWKNDVHGRERMYALWNWYRLPEWVVEIADRLRRVQIENSPAIEVISRFDYDDVFMYLDPPYLLGTRSAKQYKCEMNDAEHVELLTALQQSRAKIMISGYSSELYDSMLAGWRRQELVSHAEMGKPRIEVVWMNYEPEKQISLEDILANTDLAEEGVAHGKTDII